MKLDLKRPTITLPGTIFILSFTLCFSVLANPQWESQLEKGKLDTGITTALAAGISVNQISKKAIALKYPVCDILAAELTARVAAYAAVKALITAGGDLTHLAKCCAEPGIDVSAPVFARAALDAGIKTAIVDRLLRFAYTPPPGERGIFPQESVVAGGEIREGPYTSQDSPE